MTPTPVPAASERMTAEWVVPFCLNCGHEIPPRPDLRALVATLTARAETARAALQEIEATDWFWASAPHGGPNVKVAGPQAKRAREALSKLTAPPPTAKDRGSDA